MHGGDKLNIMKQKAQRNEEPAPNIVALKRVNIGSKEDPVEIGFWEEPVTFFREGDVANANKGLPGAVGEVRLREAFRVINAWARKNKEWGIRLQAMCLILECRYNLEEEQLDAVVAEIKKGNHSKASVKKALLQFGPKAGSIVGAADVVGHPPDPPFQEPIEPDP